MTVLRGYLSHPGRTLVVVGLVVALALLVSAGSALAAPGNGGSNGNSHGTSSSSGKTDTAGNGAASKRSETRRGPRGSSGRSRSGPPRSNTKSSGSVQAMSHDGGDTRSRQSSSASRHQGGGQSGRSGPPAHAEDAGKDAGKDAGGDAGGGQDRPHPHDDEVLSDAVEDDPARGPADDTTAGTDQAPANGDDAPFAVGTADDGVGTAPPAGEIVTAGPGGQIQTEGADLAGVVTPDDAGVAVAPDPRPGLLDRLSRGTSRALDTVLSPTRDFGVPALLVAILLVYLALQRRLDRGALPMSSLASPSDGNQTHVRFEL